MQTITDMNCRLNTVKATWTIELIFDDQSGTHSFALKDATAVETFLEVFEDCTSCRFDPETKDVVFAFEYMSGEEDEDEEEENEDEETETSENEDEEDEDEDQPGSSKVA
ncbi:MAG: hypothetical protein ACRC56_12130 [Bosea sp. (in: a-proteobacteria)]